MDETGVWPGETGGNRCIGPCAHHYAVVRLTGLPRRFITYRVVSTLVYKKASLNFLKKISG